MATWATRLQQPTTPTEPTEYRYSTRGAPCALTNPIALCLGAPCLGPVQEPGALRRSQGTHGTAPATPLPSLPAPHPLAPHSRHTFYTLTLRPKSHLRTLVPLTPPKSHFAHPALLPPHSTAVEGLAGGEPALESLLAEGGSDLSVERICAMFPFPLDAFQRKALESFLAGNSVVVCAPTGAGKTAIAEAAAAATLARGQRVIYTTPLKVRAATRCQNRKGGGGLAGRGAGAGAAGATAAAAAGGGIEGRSSWELLAVPTGRALGESVGMGTCGEIELRLWAWGCGEGRAGADRVVRNRRQAYGRSGWPEGPAA